jgi:hypothetical protein
MASVLSDDTLTAPVLQFVIMTSSARAFPVFFLSMILSTLWVLCAYADCRLLPRFPSRGLVSVPPRLSWAGVAVLTSA